MVRLDVWTSLIGSLMFAVHPIHAEAVSNYPYIVIYDLLMNVSVKININIHNNVIVNIDDNVNVIASVIVNVNVNARWFTIIYVNLCLDSSECN